MPFKKILLHELLPYRAVPDVQYLHDHKIHYWDGFLHEGRSDLSRVYGDAVAAF